MTVTPYRFDFNFDDTKATRSQIGTFSDDVTTVFDALSQAAINAATPEFELSIHLADDLADLVNRLESARWGIAITDDNRYTGERPGGVVMGKLLPRQDDHSAMDLIFRSDLWTADANAAAARVAGIHLIAHELSHSFLERSLAAADISTEFNFPPRARKDYVASLALELWGEYQADGIAESVLSKMTVGEEGHAMGVSAWDLYGELLEETLEEVLSAVYPALADDVQRYREHEQSLDTMWFTVNQAIRGALVTLMHAQVAADSAGRTNLLNEDRFKRIPAVSSYFVPVWHDFLRQLDELPLMPALGDLPQHATSDKRRRQLGHARLASAGVKPNGRRRRPTCGSHGTAQVPLTLADRR